MAILDFAGGPMFLIDGACSDVLGSKTHLQNLIGAPNNLGLDPFPDPVGHFGAPLQYTINGLKMGRY